MALNRLLYLTALLGCGVFYIAYGEWFSWVLLLAAASFPWLSLALSLRAILRFRAAPSGPDTLTAGESAELWLVGSCPDPTPPFRGQLGLKRHFTGERLAYRPEKGMDTAHCGACTVRVERARVYDYLGLFALPVGNLEEKRILIRPRPLALTQVTEPDILRSRRYQPKPGGGYAENHDLRLYRPGDSLNQIHWKLTAKTGKRILREPLEPVKEPVLLTVNLRGTPQELDRKLGRLLWLGSRLLRRELPFSLRALTGEGLLHFSVSSEKELEDAVDRLLCTPLAAQGDIRQHRWAASWQYHLGGEADG